MGSRLSFILDAYTTKRSYFFFLNNHSLLLSCIHHSFIMCLLHQIFFYFFGSLVGFGTAATGSLMKSCTWAGLHMYGPMRP